jgi:hypothetical protein
MVTRQRMHREDRSLALSCGDEQLQGKERPESLQSRREPCGVQGGGSSGGENLGESKEVSGFKSTGSRRSAAESHRSPRSHAIDIPAGMASDPQQSAVTRQR